MDFGESGANVLVILAIVALFVLNIFLRRRRGEKTPVERALSLLSDVNRNQKLVDSFQFHLDVQKFKTGSWKRNQTKVDFLDQSLQSALTSAFTMAETFNQDIDAAKKRKSTSYLSTINVEKLREPLGKSKQGLEEWLQVNIQTQQPGRRGLFG
jgi:hypothetical protein